MSDSQDKRFDRLEEMMAKGFAAIAEDISDIKSTMATKTELAELKNSMAAELTEVKSIMATKVELAEVRNTMATASELAIVRKDVENLQVAVSNQTGFAKEIDYVLSRVVTIEKHVGMSV